MKRNIKLKKGFNLLFVLVFLLTFIFDPIGLAISNADAITPVLPDNLPIHKISIGWQVVEGVKFELTGPNS